MRHILITIVISMQFVQSKMVNLYKMHYGVHGYINFRFKGSISWKIHWNVYCSYMYNYKLVQKLLDRNIDFNICTCLCGLVDI